LTEIYIYGIFIAISCDWNYIMSNLMGGFDNSVDLAPDMGFEGRQGERYGNNGPVGQGEVEKDDGGYDFLGDNEGEMSEAEAYGICAGALLKEQGQERLSTLCRMVIYRSIVLNRAAEIIRVKEGLEDSENPYLSGEDNAELQLQILIKQAELNAASKGLMDIIINNHFPDTGNTDEDIESFYKALKKVRIGFFVNLGVMVEGRKKFVQQEADRMKREQESKPHGM
jgi:hypothetical protein